MAVWFRLLAVALLPVTALFGCSTPPSPKPAMPVYAPKPVTDMIKSSYVAADALVSQISKTHPASESALIVATLVNINSLGDSSPLGRLISEQIAARFAQNHYRIVETKLRNHLYMKRNTGELTLSREVQEIAKKHSVNAIVSGTYTDSADRIFVSLKVIEIDSNIVIAAYDYALAKDTVTRSLLNPAVTP